NDADAPAPPEPEGCMGLAGLCHRSFGKGCTAQNAGFASVARRRRCAQTSPSSSRLALASLPQLDLEVRSFRNAERQYPCARPLVVFQHPAKRASQPEALSWSRRVTAAPAAP